MQQFDSAGPLISSFRVLVEDLWERSANPPFLHGVFFSRLFVCSLLLPLESLVWTSSDESSVFFLVLVLSLLF